MINGKVIAVACALSLAFGWTANGWRLNAKIAGLNTETAKIEKSYLEEKAKKQQVVIEYREREATANNENSKQYQESLDEYRKKLDDMRRNSDIAIRVCKADNVREAVRADNSATLAATAEADNAKLREDIFRVLEESKKADAWIESAFEWVNRK